MRARQTIGAWWIVVPIWSLLAGAAVAQEDNEAAKAAARDVGAVGQAAAQAAAMDGDAVSDVPGFQGTDVPQTGHTDTSMAAEAQDALADPQHSGGAVGTFVVDAALVRPDGDVDESDPGVQRAATIEAAPDASSWRADGVASGSVNECAADLADAGRSGACGGVAYCVGAGCDRVDTQANTAFVSAATQLNLVMEMGGAEFDRNRMSIFSGEQQACTVRFLGWQDCCNDAGVFIELNLVGCSVEEVELAEARAAGVTHYLGEYCAKRFLGICRRRDRAWCVFTSELGRILHEQARPQLGMTWDDCRGFTVSEIQRIDFDRVNLSEFTETLLDTTEPPGITLPDKGATGTLMRERIGEFYERND